MSAETTPRRPRRRARVAGTMVAVLVIAGATAGVFGLALPDDANGQQATAPLPPASATVTRQTLVDTQTEGGELGYGDTTTVTARLRGTVTALPAAGATVRRGQAAYQVDNDPVVLLYGTLPAYRVLAPGTKGADVKQFERNLHALGYRGFTVDKKYTYSTAVAVKRWQKDLGLSRTGTVELGRVLYAAGPVRVDSRTAAVGDASQPGTALYSWTGTARVVSVDLEVSDQRLVRVGAAVTVTLPNGTDIPGKITATETVVVPATQQDEASTTIHVTVAIDGRKAPTSLGQASVEVAFTASQRKNVLTVPVAALLALAEGGYGLEVVSGGSTQIVAVEIGLFADGQVEVSGKALAEGTTVGLPA